MDSAFRENKNLVPNLHGRTLEIISGRELKSAQIAERAERELRKAISAGYEVASWGSPYIFSRGPKQF